MRASLGRAARHAGAAVGGSEVRARAAMDESMPEKFDFVENEKRK